MNVISGTCEFRIPENTVISIGKFDGVHKGHIQILKRMKEYISRGYKLCVLTFDIPPSSLGFGTDNGVILSNEEKRLSAYRAEYERSWRQREKIQELNDNISSLKEEIEALNKNHKEATDALQTNLWQTESELENARRNSKNAEKKASELTKTLSTKLLEFEQLQSENMRVKTNLSETLKKYRDFVSPEEMASFKADIKIRIDKLYEEIKYQKDVIDQLRRGSNK